MTDAAGTIVAATPALSGSNATLSDYLGQAQPLTIFAEKAGVMRITLADGTDALATVRTLDPPFGQAAIVQPVTAILAEWQAAAFRATILACCTVLVLIALALAYFWQASRAREACQLCERMQNRVDTALGRGRCGLWDWDLARGRIYWSDSMYEMLGMKPTGQFMSFGDITALVHPQDGALAAMAELLTSSQADSIDHAFRMQSVNGEWIWVRARAELVRERAGETPHLVGIAVDITEQKALAERTATADLRLRDAIETVSEAFVLWDASNRLVMCNSKFQKFHHLASDAVAAGTPYAQVMGKGTPPIIQTQIALGERPLAGARTYEARLGDGRWLQINERRTKDGGYVSVGTDITALKRHEEQLMELGTPSLGDRGRLAQIPSNPGIAGQAARRSRREISGTEGRGRDREPGEIRISRQYEPRAADAAQRHHRLCRAHAPGDIRHVGIAEICRILQRH